MDREELPGFYHAWHALPQLQSLWQLGIYSRLAYESAGITLEGWQKEQGIKVCWRPKDEGKSKGQIFEL